LKRKNFVRALISIIVSTVAKVNIIGQENIPEQGGCIVASNHLGRLDAFLVYTVIPRDDIILTLAEKYQKVALFRWAVRNLDAIWLDRFNPDFRAMRETIKRLRNGGVLAIAPEGTRSETESLLPGKPGTAYLASKTKVPIIPAAIVGTEDRLLKRSLLKFKRASVTVQLGAEFSLGPLPSRNRESILQENSDEIMCRIAALLPSSYRGVYADHPRLIELISK